MPKSLGVPVRGRSGRGGGWPLVASCIAVLAVLAGCGGSGSTAVDGAGASSVANTGASAAPTLAVTSEEVAVLATATSTSDVALKVWREAAPTQRPKGSCVGCHGPDFLDLARIGTSRANTVRRAVIDGATEAEATTLADAIDALRAQHGIAPVDPTTFRPFQPGGALLPGATSQERDIAFGRQLQTVLPTLMGERIGTLAQAQQARDELIDLLRGHNAAGANAERVDLRSMKVGIPFPQWSADAFNATASDLTQATLNDWISDLAFEPTAADRPAWLALQQAYIARPANDTFWKMFAFVDRLELQPKAHIDSLDSTQRDRVTGYSAHKYRSALIGQHLMRTELAGTQRAFVGEGAVAFNYLLNDNFGVTLTDGYVMPQSHLWDVADYGGRGVLQASITTNPHTQTAAVALAELGFPKFVQDSVLAKDSGTGPSRWDIGSDLRLAWFWLGQTLDPSLFRIGRGGATQGGEYINATLASKGFKLFIHDAFSQAARNIARTLPETGFDQDFKPGYVPQASEFFMGYYLIQYHPGGNGLVRDDWVTPEQKQLYTRLVNNTHRMYLLLYADALTRPAGKRIHRGDFDNYTGRMRTVFSAYEPQHAAADGTLIAQVQSRLGY